MIRRSRFKRLVGVVLAGGFACGLIGSCNDFLVNATRYADPAGTVFANIPSGYFLTQAADIGDWSVDPTCVIPGYCGDDPYEPLGLIYDLDP